MVFFLEKLLPKEPNESSAHFPLLSFPPFIVAIHMIFLLFGCRYIVTLLQVGMKGKG